MAVQLTPYLSFRDNAREALGFYHSVLGGDLTLSTFADMPFPVSDRAEDQDKIMHGMLVAGDGVILMGADTPPGMDYTTPAGFSVSLSGDDDAKLRGWWDGLSEGGTVHVPLEKAPWGDTFGMFADRFGVSWMINILGDAPTA